MHKIAVIDGMNFALIAAAASQRSAIDKPAVDKYRDVLWAMLRSITKKLPHDKWYVCWDSYGGKDFRSDIDDNYKAGRSMVAGLSYKDIDDSHELFNYYNITSLEIPRSEADDAIHVLCKLLKESNPQDVITIISRDKDLIQTVQAGYANEQYDPVKKAYMEIPFYSIVKYKALVGDPADAIPGVKGIGPKKALKIITGAENLTPEQEEVYNKYLAMIDFNLNPRFEENIIAMKELIHLEG